MSTAVGIVYLFAGILFLIDFLWQREFNYGGATLLTLGLFAFFAGLDELYRIPGENLIFFSLFFAFCYCYLKARIEHKRKVSKA